MAAISANHPLRRLFTGLAEQTFIVRLGIADPALIDYLSELLVRFVHMDEVYGLRGAGGKRLGEVADMLLHAEALPTGGRTRREYFRHIGDFTLFWAGVYPDRLERLEPSTSKDFFLDYCAQGKRSYYIASTYDDEPYQREAPVLRRLSSDFEMCAYGLTEVRRDWQRHNPHPDFPPGRSLIK
jgi:hypothetical protein